MASDAHGSSVEGDPAGVAPCGVYFCLFEAPFDFAVEAFLSIVQLTG